MIFESYIPNLSHTTATRPSFFAPFRFAIDFTFIPATAAASNYAAIATLSAITGTITPTTAPTTPTLTPTATAANLLATLEREPPRRLKPLSARDRSTGGMRCRTATCVAAET